MSKFTGILSIFILLSINTQAQWITTTDFQRVKALTFSTTSFGMASCINTKIDTNFYGNRGSIIVTSDSGNTWQNSLILPAVDFYDITHTNPSTFYATGVDTSGNGILAKTFDAGQNWDTMHFDRPLIRVSFPSDSIGYLSTDRNFLYKTLDSGKTWSQLPYNDTNGIYRMQFINDSLGFITLGYSMYKTEDGGLSWTNNYTGRFIRDFTFVKNDSLAYFVTSNYGVTNTSIDYIFIYKSTDMGETWTTADTILDHYFPVAIEFPSADTGYITGQFMMYKTVDGGRNWEKQYATPPMVIFFDWMEDLYCVNARDCYTGGHGYFFRTFNGGDTIDPTGINEFTDGLKSKIKLYPNPTNEQFYMEFSGQEQLHFQLYNLMGQKVEAAVQKEGARYRFSSGHLTKGLYFLRVSDGKREEVFKMVKD